MSRFEPKHVHQMDGAPCSATNCWAAGGAWLAAASSGGQRTPDPQYFRSRAGAGGRDCRPGGLGDVIAGLMKMELWGRCTMRYDLTGPEFRSLITRKSGAVVLVPTDFEKWPDRKCQPGYAGYHMVGIVCGKGTGKQAGMVRAMNPLCRDYTWVDTDQVIASALEYSIEHGDGKAIDCIVCLPPKEDRP